MISSRVDKASKGAGKRRHHARRAATNGDRHTTKLSRRGRKFPNYDRVASPDHEVVIIGSSHDPGTKDEQTANVDEKEKEKQNTSQAKNDSAKGQETVNYTNAKFSGPRNMEQLKKRHDELAEYIRRTKKGIAAQKAEKDEEGENHG